MKKYNLINNILGWLLFLIAAIVYSLTVEPTTSFWDCGEFIATAFKLEVGHPPGAPFFMILARFFSLFAPGTDTVALMINMLSVISSALTITFLFWSITHLVKKIAVKKETTEFSKGSFIAIMGSGIVGALAFTFSDTFWFSAVEGEVYALSTLFTAVVFWAILKWENVAHEKYANRWIILIAYLMGLSIGVHLLNLLTIPAIVFVYYFKKYKVTKIGIVYASLIAVAILGILMYGVIPGIVKVASWFELLFVNGFGLPFNTGWVVYLIILLGLITWLLRYSYRRKKYVLNTIVLAFTVILIGYSSFAMIYIRSLANPPMDENNPENVFALLSYLNREQYGDRPLVKGQHFNAQVLKTKEGKSEYTQRNGRYEVVRKKPEYEYDSEFVTVFPRMWSSQGKHVKAYMQWAGIDEADMYEPRKDKDGNLMRNRRGEVRYDRSKPKEAPTFGQNLKFFFKYQIGHMYLRYFMWNFSGRQSDLQGHGGILKGNWLSGIPFIDDSRLGPQNNLPDKYAENKSRNVYYMLPLLLGLIGLFFHAKVAPKDFSIITMLFFFTGIAVVVYLNQYPFQPRERDYAYVGSFYAFAIWLGVGIYAIYNFLNKKVPSMVSAAIAILVPLVLVPAIMAAENWDDHDRSGRYTARDFAINYLESCAPNAILFTNGDNDTFPLWYAQEVEGVRTDVRVVNLSLLNTDWYIDQMKRKAYDSEPVPFSLTKEQYIKGKRDYVPVFERFKDRKNIDKIMEFVAMDDAATKVGTQANEKVDYIPTKKIYLEVDSATVLNNGTVRKQDANKIVDRVTWNINKSYVLKNELMVLDLLATNNWERPVYFAITVGTDAYMNLHKYFQVEGLAYRFVPVKHGKTDGQIGKVATDIMYDNVMNKFKWGRLNEPDVFLDDDNLRMTMNLRNNFARLASALLDENKTDSALKVLNRCMEIMPRERVPYDIFIIGIAEGYYKAGEKEKGHEILKALFEQTSDEIEYYLGLPSEYTQSVDNAIQRAMAIMQEVSRISKIYDSEEYSKKIEDKFMEFYREYAQIVSQ